LTRTIAYILDIASDCELAALLAMGMTLPRLLERRALAFSTTRIKPEHLPHGRPTRAEINVAEIDTAIEVVEGRKNKTGRPPRRVLSSNGDRWSDAYVAAWALGVKRTTINNGCGGSHMVRGMELWWEKDAPKWVVRKVLARRRSAA
jgi:hypothetical protein